METDSNRSRLTISVLQDYVTRLQTTTAERQNFARQFESRRANQKLAFEQQPITNCYFRA